MGLNVELLQLTHGFAQFVGLPSVLRRQGRLAHHPIALPEPGIGHREIRIEADGSLVERDGSSPFASSRCLPAQAVSLKGLKRRRRRLFKRSIKLPHSAKRLAQLVPHLGSYLSQSIEHIVLAAGLSFRV